jgi:hypothetical protein
LKLSREVIDELASNDPNPKWHFRDYTDAVYTFLNYFVCPNSDVDKIEQKMDGIQCFGLNWNLNCIIKEKDLITAARIKQNQGWNPHDTQRFLEDLRQLKHWSEGREMIALRVHNDYTKDSHWNIWEHQRCIVISFRHRKMFLSEIRKAMRYNQIRAIENNGIPSNFIPSLINEELKQGNKYRMGLQQQADEEMDEKAVNNVITELEEESDRMNDEEFDKLVDKEGKSSPVESFKKLFEEAIAMIDEEISNTQNPNYRSILSDLKKINQSIVEKQTKILEKELAKSDPDLSSSPEQLFEHILRNDFEYPDSVIKDIESALFAKEPIPLPPLENDDPNSVTEEQLDAHIQKHNLDTLVTWDRHFPHPFSKYFPFAYTKQMFQTLNSSSGVKRVMRRLKQLSLRERYIFDFVRVPLPQHRCKMYSIPSDFLEAMKRVPWPADQSLLIESFEEHVLQRGSRHPHNQPPLTEQFE